MQKGRDTECSGFRDHEKQSMGTTLHWKTDKTYKVLLDTGSSSSIISTKVAKYGVNIQKGKGNKVEWNTAAGSFSTTTMKQLVFQLPEFSSKKKIVHNFHVTQGMALTYDMIIGRDLLNELGIVVDFAQKVLTWEGTDVNDDNSVDDDNLKTSIY